MSKVFTIGEILVEIMASKIGQPFDQPGIWNGPYPSGAPASFYRPGDTSWRTRAASLAAWGMMALVILIYIVWLLTVWTSRGISVLPLEATGSAFVTYHNSGDREF